MHYYASIPSEEEHGIINEVLHDQTVGLMHQPHRTTNGNIRDILTHDNAQPYSNAQLDRDVQLHIQQRIAQFRTPHERDLSKIISEWK